MYYGNITLKTKNRPFETINHSLPAQSSLHLFGKPSYLTSTSTSVKSMPFELGTWLMRKWSTNPESLSSSSTKSRQKTLLHLKDHGCQHMNVMQMLSSLLTHIELKNWAGT